ncbi:MAG: hypothetical protein SFU56_00700 [Capsulimonadales bacterium]|nr:hypothetical protein [Capsulimonadales bacterium]
MRADGIRWSYLLRTLPRYLLPVLTMAALSAFALLVGQKLRRRQPPVLPKDHLVVSVLNVGHGEAAWLRTPAGRFIVIGAGPVGQGDHVSRSLKIAQAKRIELLIVPYPYAEAIGGMSDLLGNFPVDRIWEPGGPVINQWHTQFREGARRKGIPVTVIRAGAHIEMDGVTVEVLSPGEPLVSEPPKAANNSVVVRIGFGRCRFLFAGGLERKGENLLIGRQPDLRADWLRAARFASGKSSSPEFLRLVSPDIAVVSVGPNRSGYPHPDTMERLTATGASVYRTDTQSGSLQFTCDGETISGPY